MELEEKLICSDCEMTVDEDRVYQGLDDEILCEQCFYDKYFYCERCGRVEYQDEETSIYTDCRNQHSEMWCRDCRDSRAFYCSSCGDWYSDEEVTSYETHNSDVVCEYCREDHYTRCYNCDELYHDDDVYYDEDGDEHYCSECWHNHQRRNLGLITGYHDRPPIEYYYGKDEQPTMPFKGFGIELEVDDGNISRGEMSQELHDIVGDHIYYNRDGSLGENGFEIITMPHTEKALYEIEWEDVLRHLVGNGFTSHNNKKCGLHMHISRAMFGDTEEERTDNIAKMVMFYELFWNDIRRFSRRTEQQVSSWANRYFGDQQATEQNCKQVVGTQYNPRYRAVNLNNRDTIEFRIMRGSLRYETFMATLDFLITTAKNCKYIDWTAINDQSQWLHGIKDDTIEYMKRRRCFGYTNEQNQDEEDDDNA